MKTKKLVRINFQRFMKWLARHGACLKATDFCLEQGSFTKAWNKCPESDWMFWLWNRVVHNGSDPISRKDWDDAANCFYRAADKGLDGMAAEDRCLAQRFRKKVSTQRMAALVAKAMDSDSL